MTGSKQMVTGHNRLQLLVKPGHGLYSELQLGFGGLDHGVSKFELILSALLIFSG